MAAGSGSLALRIHTPLFRTYNRRVTLKLQSPGPHLFLRRCPIFPRTAAPIPFSRFMAAGSGSLAVGIHTSLLRTNNGSLIGLPRPMAA
jgi:hypothetical protein